MLEGIKGDTKVGSPLAKHKMQPSWKTKWKADLHRHLECLYRLLLNQKRVREWSGLSIYKGYEVPSTPLRKVCSSWRSYKSHIST